MKLSTNDLHELADCAIAAATEAGQMIARSRPQEVERKAGGASLASQVVTEIDKRSEDIILEVLRPTLEPFALGLLTEEQQDDGGRLTADNFWCIDPLDGTLPFIEGTPGYAVSIALVGNDGTPHIGVVYDPVESTLIHAVAGSGVYRDQQRWLLETARHGELSVFADRSFLASDERAGLVDGLERIAQDMGFAGVRIESSSGAVMNACAVLANTPACYIKFPKPTAGGGSLWDFAATSCIFTEAGASATDIYGARLDLNRPDSTFMNHRGVLFASDDELAQRVRTLHQ